MAIFAVIGLGDATALRSKIEESFPNSYYALEKDTWLVAASGETARSVSEKLSLTRGSNMRGIIVTVGGYYGLAPADVWEWLKEKMEKTATANISGASNA